MVKFTAYVKLILILAAVSIELSYLSLWIQYQNSLVHIFAYAASGPVPQTDVHNCVHLCPMANMACGTYIGGGYILFYMNLI
jgi:hypothetical protein